jgi:hypothetical protein
LVVFCGSDFLKIKNHECWLFSLGLPSSSFFMSTARHCLRHCCGTTALLYCIHQH